MRGLIATRSSAASVLVACLLLVCACGVRSNQPSQPQTPGEQTPGERTTAEPGPSGPASSSAPGPTSGPTSDSAPATPVSPSASPPDAERQFRTSDHGGELVSSLPIGKDASNTDKRVVFSEPLDAHAGQILMATAEFQVTNDLGVNVFVGSQIILADSPTDTAGTAITPANGENVTPDEHHGQQSKAGMLSIPPGAVRTRYVNLVVWSSATSADSGARLRVDQGYGKLSVVSW